MIDFLMINLIDHFKESLAKLGGGIGIEIYKNQYKNKRSSEKLIKIFIKNKNIV